MIKVITNCYNKLIYINNCYELKYSKNIQSLFVITNSNITIINSNNDEYIDYKHSKIINAYIHIDFGNVSFSIYKYYNNIYKELVNTTKNLPLINNDNDKKFIYNTYKCYNYHYNIYLFLLLLKFMINNFKFYFIKRHTGIQIERIKKYNARINYKIYNYIIS